MTIRAQYPQIFKTIIPVIAVDMVQFQGQASVGKQILHKRHTRNQSL